MGIKVEERSSSSSALMGQRYAKHQMQSGVALYHQRGHQGRAVARWRAALPRLRSAEDRFITLGYIAQAYCDAGDYDSMLYYALEQVELANQQHDEFMRSEAFLNLSKGYERTGDFTKAINYGRASLQHPNSDSRTPGYAHLAMALAYAGLSDFQSSLHAFEQAMSVANSTADRLLELQVCIGLGSLFTCLRDSRKALIFLRNALTILSLIRVDAVHAKYKSAILLHLSVVLRQRGSLADAREACLEALKLAQQTGNRPVYARCLCSLADINRELGETEAMETITKSWARYEQAFRLMRELNDRMGEVIVLGSMAKAASESRSHYTGQCECQAIQLNKKCLEVAREIGCRHAAMKCHLRLQELYAQLADDDSEEMAAYAACALVEEMGLYCNFCGQRYACGRTEEALQAMHCSHIFHEKCLTKQMASASIASTSHSTTNPSDYIPCPKCQAKASTSDSITAAASSRIEPPPISQPARRKTSIMKQPTSPTKTAIATKIDPRALVTDNRVAVSPPSTSAQSSTLIALPLSTGVTLPGGSVEAVRSVKCKEGLGAPLRESSSLTIKAQSLSPQLLGVARRRAIMRPETNLHHAQILTETSAQHFSVSSFTSSLDNLAEWHYTTSDDRPDNQTSESLSDQRDSVAVSVAKCFKSTPLPNATCDLDFGAALTSAVPLTAGDAIVADTMGKRKGSAGLPPLPSCKLNALPVLPLDELLRGRTAIPTASTSSAMTERGSPTSSGSWRSPIILGTFNRHPQPPRPFSTSLGLVLTRVSGGGTGGAMEEILNTPSPVWQLPGEREMASSSKVGGLGQLNRRASQQQAMPNDHAWPDKALTSARHEKAPSSTTSTPSRTIAVKEREAHGEKSSQGDRKALVTRRGPGVTDV